MIIHIFIWICFTLQGNESKAISYSFVVVSGDISSVARLCDFKQITLVSSNRTKCIPCKSCPPGFGTSISCGSVIKINGKEAPQIECLPCQKGRTYSDMHSSLGCKSCTKCTDKGHVMRNCTRYSNSVCYSCREGFYFSKEKSLCLPCWGCCGDGKDKKVHECMTQGSHNRHCSFENKMRCQYTTDRIPTSQPPSMSEFYETTGVPKAETKEEVNVNRTIILTTPGLQTKRNIHKNKLREISENETRNIMLIGLIFIIVIFVVLSVIVASCLVKIKKGRNLGKSKHCLVTESTSKNQTISENNQSDDFDDWAKYDSFSGMYILKSGVIIRHDKSSKGDGNRNLVVEVLRESLPSHFKILDPGYVFVGSIFKFYSQGTQFEKPVEVTIPHNALIDNTNKNCEIKVLYMDERKGNEAKWKEIESEVDTEWDKVKFYTKTLLTYAVVGRPIASAKKRMQFALFSMQEMISDRLEMVLYLLDEGNTSLDYVIKENTRKGWEMIGSLYAVFVDCISPADIIIDIEELLEPWSLVDLNDKVISSQLLQDSYFNIPTVHAIFRRSKRGAQKFYCNFRVDVGGREINIPAVTFVPEEPFCFYVEVHNDDPSIFNDQNLARDLPYDINYLMCRKLDIPAKGLGQWRDFGRHFELTDKELQECCREYATLDGSPSKALVEKICCKNPKVTVGEFAKCLEKLGRGDVMSVLSKVKYKL